jgi:dTDP-4-dehydrorhamnose 3,5-epimerase-like enzyme
MNIQHIKLTFEDSRGTITDIVEQIDFNGATIISSKAGSIRGNHYHKESVQYIYVLEGKMLSRSKKMGEKLTEVVVKKGDLVSHEKYEAHMFEALEDTTFLVLSSGLRTGKDYEKDTFRISFPIGQFEGDQ